MNTDFHDVVVVGAGAAGLLAAAAAGDRGKKTLLLEKNTRAGVKILMSGGTRCNVTHDTDQRGIVEAFGRPGRFLHSALARLSPSDVREMLLAEDVPTKVEETGKVFPASDRAADVLRALLARVRRSGAELALNEPLQDLNSTPDGWRLVTSRRELQCSKLILTTGGRSYPASGTTGDGYRWVEQLGHTLIPLCPALTPITTHARWVHELRGITLPDVGVSIVPHNRLDNATGEKGLRRATVVQDRGSVLLAHFGLTGPAILNVSRYVGRSDSPTDLTLLIDSSPDTSEHATAEDLDRFCAREGKSLVFSLVAKNRPRRFAEAIFAQLQIPLDLRAADCTREQRLRLVNGMKRLPISISGILGYRKAEVTAGGVSLDEVDSRTLESKRVANLFLAGEILDLDGPIGGYNFQAAFSTGWLAGLSV